MATLVLPTTGTMTSAAADPKGKKIIDNYTKCKSDRFPWETLWQETAEYFYPNFTNTMFTDGYQTSVAERKNKQLFDHTGVNAALRAAALVESLLTPRNQRWHGLQALDRKLQGRRKVQLWFEEVTDILFRHRYAAEANYAAQQQAVYQSLLVFGLGVMFVDKRPGGGLRYMAIHVAQINFDMDYQGRVNRAYRGPIRLTAEQALDQFGEDNPKIPKVIKDAAKTGNKSQMFDFLHYVGPRQDYDPNRKDAAGMEYESVYVEMSSGAVVEESGYRTFPYMISRYSVAPGERFGRSPAMDVLPSAKVLNEQKKTYLKAGHRAVDPILLARDEGVLDIVGSKAGQIIPGTLNDEGKPLLTVLPTGQVNLATDMMEMERQQINAAFNLDILQLLADGTMTATEVMERSREKGAILSPALGRQQTEGTAPMIDRELDLLSQQGQIPPMPQELAEAGGEYDVVYDSPLSRAQKAEQSAGLMRTLEFAMNYVAQTQDPAPLDHFNMDVIIPDLSMMNATPARWLNTLENVQAIRQGRQQQQETQQMIEAGPSIAAISKNMQGSQ